MGPVVTPHALRLGVVAAAGLVLVVGAAFPAVAAARVGAAIDGGMGADGAMAAALPALGLLWTLRLARDHRLATWAALLGALLTLGLGLALYVAALRSGARPTAPVLAVVFVPVRQLAAVAVVAWVVWTARKTR